jgi:hypothetical protein
MCNTSTRIRSFVEDFAGSTSDLRSLLTKCLEKRKSKKKKKKRKKINGYMARVVV